LGQTCSVSNDCEDPSNYYQLTCNGTGGAGSISGKCVVEDVWGPNEACNPGVFLDSSNSDGGCSARLGLRCTSNTCGPAIASGQPCSTASFNNNDAAIQCPKSTVCSPFAGYKCVSPGGNGASCNDSIDCGSQYDCIILNGTGSLGSCLPLFGQATGQPCNKDVHCGANSFCNNQGSDNLIGSCTQIQNEGNNCNPGDSSCGAGTACAGISGCQYKCERIYGTENIGNIINAYTNMAQCFDQNNCFTLRYYIGGTTPIPGDNGIEFGQGGCMDVNCGGAVRSFLSLFSSCPASTLQVTVALLLSVFAAVLMF